MVNINFNHKTFSLIDNSENGKVSSDTVFEYQQNGNLVTANYHGGSVIYGKIIALHKGTYLDMRYQCLTTDYELKAGKAIAKISELENGKVKLSLNWEWLDSDNQSGTSEYIEN
ncbi:n-acetylglutamate synthase [Psychroserpens sp. MEBiC05023]